MIEYRIRVVREETEGYSATNEPITNTKEVLDIRVPNLNLRALLLLIEENMEQS